MSEWARESDRRTHRVITVLFALATVALVVPLGIRAAAGEPPGGLRLPLLAVAIAWPTYYAASRALRGQRGLDVPPWVLAVVFVPMMSALLVAFYVLSIQRDLYVFLVMALLLATLFKLLALIGNDRFWSGRSVHSRSDEPHAFYSFSPQMWRAEARALPVMLFLGYPAALALTADLVLTRGVVAGIATSAWSWYPTARLVLAGVVAVTVALVSSVMYLNQPRLLVPPHRRDEPGLVQHGSGTR